MPQPNLPPTPSSSTEITGKNDLYPSQFDQNLALPPAALDIHSLDSRSTANASLNTGTRKNSNTFSFISSSVYQPLSPSSPVNASACGAAGSHKRKASSDYVSDRDPTNIDHDGWCAGLAESNCTLPLPPTRSRKIIQMNPCTAQVELSVNRVKSSTTTADFGDIQNRLATAEGSDTEVTATQSRATTASNGNSETRRKGDRDIAAQASTAGRKSARKTAHSLIERRRRSKMNKEFGVLKDMIPACAGQEMHKLAILQASIEYTQYLKECITDLQSHKRQQFSSATSIESRKSFVCSSVALPAVDSASTRKLYKSPHRANDRMTLRKRSSTVAYLDKEMIDSHSNRTEERDLTIKSLSESGLRQTAADSTDDSLAARKNINRSSHTGLCSITSGTKIKTKDFIPTGSAATENFPKPPEVQRSHQRHNEQSDAWLTIKPNGIAAKSYSLSPSNTHQTKAACTSSPNPLSSPLASTATLPSFPPPPINIDYPYRLSLDPHGLRRTNSGGMAANACKMNESHSNISSLCGPAPVLSASSTGLTTLVSAAGGDPGGMQAKETVNVKAKSVRAGADKRLTIDDTRGSVSDDCEATAALLMLNRAGAGASAGDRRHMSVNDLLSG